jgi:3-oxoacyl-[acyl-carrier protein] reductase
MTKKVALVTGAGRGIGKELALGLASAGMNVGVLARSTAELEDTAESIRAAGGGVHVLTADVADWGAVQTAVASAVSRLGPIDLLINNAGIGDPGGEFWEVEIEDWWRVHEVNVRGVALATRAVLPGMIARRSGRIVNIASDIAIRATARNLAYSSSKAAVLRLTENLALATKQHGVFVFAVSPGLVRTRLTEKTWQTMEATLAAGEPPPDGLLPAHWAPPGAIVRLVLALAEGGADSLSGRYIHATKDELEQMLRSAVEIERQELYTMKLRKLPKPGLV